MKDEGGRMKDEGGQKESDEELQEDLLDIATLVERQNEPSRPFREYMAEKRRIRKQQ